MRPFLVLVLFGSVFAMTPARAGESSGLPQSGYWKCQTIRASETAPLYVSDIFELQAVPAEVGSAFEQTLADKYGVRPRVSCSMAYKSPGILEKLKADDQRWFQQIRAGGGKVVETHWTFAPQAARFAYQCWGGAQVADGANQRRYHFFYADPIEAPGDSEAKVNEAWVAHLADLRPGWFFTGSEGCQRLPADKSLRPGVIASIMDPWKARNADIQKLDWSYAPLVKTAAGPQGESVSEGAASQQFYQCWMSDAAGGYYITDGFSSAKDHGAVGAAWRAYITAAHPPKGFAQIGCGPLPADSEERKSKLVQNAATAGAAAIRVAWTP